MVPRLGPPGPELASYISLGVETKIAWNTNHNLQF